MEGAMPEFRLGVTMAGAISAGAYSGGVFDMLFEVLDAWEAEKQRLRDQKVPLEQWPVPSHDVVVPVISGASAGSITGSVGLLALADAASGTAQRHDYAQVGTVETRLPRLYAAWVERPRFVADHGGQLLGTDDLADSKAPLGAVLDTTVLDQIARAAVTGFAATRSRPYLSDRLHLFVTVTNLAGIPYDVGFTASDGSSTSYVMTSHADRVHFVLHGVGTAQIVSPWADPDPAIVLDMAELPRLPASIPAAWQGYLDATLASGGFPIGLRARYVPQLGMADILARQWPIARQVPGAAGLFRLVPDYAATVDPTLFDKPYAELKLALGQEKPLARAAVDGGVIDNEPFELARWTLMANPPARNPPEAENADRAVIMIDPFPSATTVPPPPDASLLGVLKRMVPTLIDQARFKLDAAVAALDENVKSRFLISPVRKLKPGGEPETFPIACGLLGGFGGFLSEEFRAHDYQLGRLNAYLFLRDHFGFPLTNKVLAGGYGKAAQTGAFEAQSNDKAAGRLYQMIPVLPSIAMPQPPTWPLASQAEVDGVVAAVGKRADALVGRLAPQVPLPWALRKAGEVYWSLRGRKRVCDKVRDVLLADLRRRGQI
jgi:hypothetical protein